MSYNKETSWKSLTDMSSGGSVKRLNFYGVKMINNTTGSDPILGSRVLKIHTRKIPSHLQNALGTTEPWDVIELNKLRDDLHTWTFENVGIIDQRYQRLFPFSTDRTSEIFAPLRVFAELSADEELRDGLIRALEFQTMVSDDLINPIDLMKEAVKRLIVDGRKEVSPTQIVLEMEKLISDKPLADSDENSKWKNPSWIGRQLRIEGLVEINSLPARQMSLGKSVRVYPINQAYLKTILAECKISAQSKTFDSK